MKLFLAALVFQARVALAINEESGLLHHAEVQHTTRQVGAEGSIVSYYTKASGNCPDGTSISLESECAAAAVQLGLKSQDDPVRSVRWGGAPKGCFQKIGNQKIVFNEIGGVATADKKLICKGDPTEEEDAKPEDANAASIYYAEKDLTIGCPAGVPITSLADCATAALNLELVTERHFIKAVDWDQAPAGCFHSVDKKDGEFVVRFNVNMGGNGKETKRVICRGDYEALSGDCYGNGIAGMIKTFEECQTECTKRMDCKGFSYKGKKNAANKCYLKGAECIDVFPGHCGQGKWCHFKKKLVSDAVAH